MSNDIQLSADPLLSHASITKHQKSLMPYAKAYYYQVTVFLDHNSKNPVGHRLESGDWVF